MRAKVKITGIIPHMGGAGGEVISEQITFAFPSKDGPYTADGSDEDQQFARYTPNASLSMTVNNPELIGKFKTGEKFYLDFQKIED